MFVCDRTIPACISRRILEVLASMSVVRSRIDRPDTVRLFVCSFSLPRNRLRTAAASTSLATSDRLYTSSFSSS